VSIPQEGTVIDDYEQNLSRLAAWLADPENAQPACVVAADARLAATSGLYAWHGDEVARELVGNLFDPAPVGPLYVGRINAALQLRTGRNRLRNTKASSLRCSLAAMLWDELELRCVAAQTIDPVGNLRLTDWMLEHLSVAIAPVATKSVIAPLEEDVLRRLDPPLNLTKVGWSPGRTRLRRLRGRHLSMDSAILDSVEHDLMIRAAEASDPGVVVPISRATGKGSRRSRRWHPAVVRPEGKGA
jgi:hypothetical protein